MTLTLNFQGQIWNSLCLSQKWSDCHETKSKHIDWILGIKYDYQVWPWPWPWPWHLSQKLSSCREMKNELIDWRVGFHCSHLIWPWSWLDLGFSRSNFKKLYLRNGNADLHCRSFMNRTMTFWWPRWSVRIYQIVTGVTSDVSVLPTHLVCFKKLLFSSWPDVELSYKNHAQPQERELCISDGLCHLKWCLWAQSHGVLSSWGFMPPMVVLCWYDLINVNCLELYQNIQPLLWPNSYRE